jgi:hypothetical protein
MAGSPVQLSLFPDVPRLLQDSAPRRPCLVGVVVTGCGLQGELFADATLLRTAIDRAIGRADHAEAARLSDVLAADHGADSVADLLFLADLAALDWHAPRLDRALAAWAAARAKLPAKGLRAFVAAPFFARLADCFDDADLVTCGDADFADLVNALARGDDTTRARTLVRDALLAGRELAPRAFDDPRVRDVLAEDMPPAWLASLGALRRAWPVPRPSDEEVAIVERSLAEPPPAENGNAARQFWCCMRVAGLRSGLPEPLLHAVRSRMKALSPELHAIYMREP